MDYWIIPSNNNLYRLDDRLLDHNIISWRQQQNFAVGDTIFIYTTAPISRITYKLDVIGANLNTSVYNDDGEYWVDYQVFVKKAIKVKKFAEFRLVERIPFDERLTLDSLKKHGLKTVQIAQRLNGELKDYILSALSTIDTFGFHPDEISEQDTLTEGTVSKVFVNRYERSAEARRRCIALKGCKCSVCGIDFEKEYGDIGQGFIHVHHTVPLASIKKDYQIDYEKDLIPVCPNCHSMLHKKNPPFSIDELKKMMNRN